MTRERLGEVTKTNSKDYEKIILFNCAFMRKYDELGH